MPGTCAEGVHITFFIAMFLDKTFTITPRMREFAEAQTGRTEPPMCTMYDSDSLFSISEIGAKLVFASVMRDVRKVNTNDEMQFVKAQDPLKVVPATNKYASFVCEFNPHFSKEDFERVYDAIEEYYFDYLQSRFYDASDYGENWMDVWRDSLLD